MTNSTYEIIIDELLPLIGVEREMVSKEGIVSFNIDDSFDINLFENTDKNTLVLVSHLAIDPLFLTDQARFYRMLLERNFLCAHSQVSSIALTNAEDDGDRLSLCCELPLTPSLTGADAECKLLLLVEDTEALIKELDHLRYEFGECKPDGNTSQSQNVSSFEMIKA